LATVEGIVTALKGRYALVITEKKIACEGCSERETCDALGETKETEYIAMNHANAGVGDRVVLSFSSGTLYKLSFFLYVFPILALISGAVIGDKLIARSFHIDPSICAAALGFLLFFMAIWVIKIQEKQAKKSDKYKPTILSVKKNPPPHPFPLQPSTD